MESNGPDVKVRGSAKQIFDKYEALARDAAASGNRVKAENLRQHAEHYLRIVNAIESAKQTAREEQDAKSSTDGEDNSGEEEGDTRSRRRYPPRARRNETAESAEEAGQDNADTESASEDEKPAVAKSTRRRKAPKRESEPETDEVVEAAE